MMNLIIEKRFLFLAAFGLLFALQTASGQIIVRRHSPNGEAYPNEPQAEKLATETEKKSLLESESDSSVEQSPTLSNQTSIETPKTSFRRIETTPEQRFDLNGDAKKNEVDDENSKANVFSTLKINDEKEPRYVRETAVGRGFNYRGAFAQSLIFLAVQHGYATTQPKTREALKHGAFWRDYADSVKSLRGWDDGGRFFTNYIAHPMQGAFTGHIYVQNSPQALREQFSMSPKYWKTRAKALLWTTAWSTQFEIGPISQASIGNVGLKGKQTWEDIIVTPTLGTAMLIGEDAIDQYAIKFIERRTSSRYVKIFARMLLNPTRNFSNLLRFREPWYRDRAQGR